MHLVFLASLTLKRGSSLTIFFQGFVALCFAYTRHLCRGLFYATFYAARPEIYIKSGSHTSCVYICNNFKDRDVYNTRS